MSIKNIKADDLRRLKGKEGLILQGCGGDVQEWLDGINRMLTNDGILLDDTKFENAYVFSHDDLTNILFSFEGGVQLDMGRLAMWRLHTHEPFGGKWLSDYVENRLGGFLTEETAEQKKPDCPLLNQDGNIFKLLGIASQTLRRNGMSDQAKEMTDRIYKSGSYDEALGIIGEYVNITGEDDTEDMGEGMDMSL